MGAILACASLQPPTLSSVFSVWGVYLARPLASMPFFIFMCLWK
jgi:hypothetical protein